MTTFYLTGQNNFGNRGCEALVRSTVASLRAQVPDARFLVPSLDGKRDAQQWPDAARYGVRFVPCPVIPSSYRQWGRLCRILPFLKSAPWPSLEGLPNLEEPLQQCDAVLSIGGDNYSLDYGLVSLFFFVGIAERALDMGKTVGLWGASVGPFSSEPRVERLMAEHLARLHMVSIRESHSLAYVRKIAAVGAIAAVTDSAFALARQSPRTEDFWPQERGAGVLGLNLSPIIEKHAGQETGAAIKEQAARFIERVLATTDMSVLLIPHVAALNGARFNNDYLYLQDVARLVRDAGARLQMVPAGFNACELKDVIARCRFFIGARTHATIAALSSCVPTISIAYSVKARGLNNDLFGHERYVLPSPQFSADSLGEHLLQLQQEEDAIRRWLAERMPQWRERAESGARIFAGTLARRRAAWEKESGLQPDVGDAR